MTRLTHLPALLAALLLCSCEPPKLPEVRTEPPAVTLPASVRQLSVDEAAAFIQNTPGVTLLDLREDWEIQKQGRIAGSIWADFLNDERFDAATAKLEPARPILIYCAIGGRSRLAAEKLSARGFQSLSILSGGMEAWQVAGKPVEK